MSGSASTKAGGQKRWLGIRGLSEGEPLSSLPLSHLLHQQALAPCVLGHCGAPERQTAWSLPGGREGQTRTRGWRKVLCYYCYPSSNLVNRNQK